MKNKTTSNIYIWILCLFFGGCSTGYVQMGIATKEIYSEIDFKVNSFNLKQAEDLYTEYENHFSQKILNKFKKVLEEKLIDSSLKATEHPDVILEITQFNILNNEIVSLTIDIKSGEKIYRTIEYRQLVGPGYSQRISYFKKMPGVNMVADKVLASLKRRFNLE